VKGVECRRLAGGGRSYLARVRRAGVNRSAVFDTSEEAAAWRAAALAALRTGTDLPDRPKPAVGLPVASVTVADACRELVRGMRSGVVRDGRGRQYKPATVTAYEHRLRLHVLPLIGAIPLAVLRRGDVKRLIDDLVVRVSPQTAAGARDALRVALRLQVELEVIPANPCVGVRAPTADARPARFLNVEEAGRLQTAADEDVDGRIGPLVALALATGLRRGELEALPWGSAGLDVAAGTVRVAVSLDRRGNVGPTKNRKPRSVPIGPDTIARLRRWRLASGRPQDGTRVFPGWYVEAWVRSRKAAKLPDPQPRFHDLRHTAATFLLAAGLRSHVVAELLGHEDAGLVDRLYGHALPNEVNGAGAALDAWRSGVFATGIATRAAVAEETTC